MRAALWTAVILGLWGVEAARADPQIQAKNFSCELRPATNGGWDKQGAVDAFTVGRTLVLNFQQNNGSALDSMSTTNTEFEYQVEARCPGSVTLRDNKPFKIRDFAFRAARASIGIDGKIELKVLGLTTVDGTNQKDSFEKVWSIDQKALNDLAGAFASKAESNTVCGSQLTLRFDELRALVQVKKNSGDFTDLAVESLNINLDPC